MAQHPAIPPGPYSLYSPYFPYSSYIPHNPHILPPTPFIPPLNTPEGSPEAHAPKKKKRETEVNYQREPINKPSGGSPTMPPLVSPPSVRILFGTVLSGG